MKTYKNKNNNKNNVKRNFKSITYPPILTNKVKETNK